MSMQAAFMHGARDMRVKRTEIPPCYGNNRRHKSYEQRRLRLRSALVRGPTVSGAHRAGTRSQRRNRRSWSGDWGGPRRRSRLRGPHPPLRMWGLPHPAVGAHTFTVRTRLACRGVVVSRNIWKSRAWESTPCRVRLPTNMEQWSNRSLSEFTPAATAMSNPATVCWCSVAGTIGLLSLAVAKVFGAKRAYIVAKYDVQVRMAEAMGADGIIRLGTGHLVRQVQEISDGEPIDTVIETVGGSAPTIDQAVSAVRPEGKVVVTGVFPKPVLINLEQALGKEAKIIFSVCYSAENGTHDYEVASDLIASGKVNATQLITHRFPLNQTPEAFETALDKTTGSVKAMINVSAP